MSARNKPEPTAWDDVAHIPGLTYRRFDHWVVKGYIHVTIERGHAGGIGDWRTITPGEVAVVAALTALTRAGLAPKSAVVLARDIAARGVGKLGGLYVVAEP